MNGTVYTLQPDSALSIRLAEGPVQFSIVDAPSPFATQTATIESPFWTRPFADHAFVVNPDGAAILSRMRVYYASKNQTPPAPEIKTLAGQFYYHERGIDAAFEELPQSVSTKSSAPVSRVALWLAGPRATHVPASLLVANLRRDVGDRTTWDIAMRHLLLEPEKTDMLSVIDDDMPPKELADFLRGGLDRRPVELRWHRAFQHAMEKSEQHAANADLYRAMLAKEPTNKDLMYLLSRAVEDYDESLALLRAATEGESASREALTHIGFVAMSSGRWDEAEEAYRRAVAAAPNDTDAAHQLAMALLAQRKYDELIKVAQRIEAMPPPKNWWGFEWEAIAYYLSGHAEKVPDTIGRLQKAWVSYGHLMHLEASAILESMGDYLRGDAPKWAARRRQTVIHEARLGADLTVGDLKAAEESIKQVDHKAPFHLMVRLIAGRQEKSDIAEAHLRRAIEAYRGLDADGRVVARALDGDESVRIEEVLRVRHRPLAKAAILITLGYQRPAWREPCFALARKLNESDPTFPHLLLRDFLDPSATRPAATQPANP